MNDCICANTAIASAEVHRELLLMSVEKGRYYSFDDIGTAIYKRLRNPVEVSALCAEMAKNYHCDSAVVEPDILHLLHRLLENDLITVQRGSAA